jgi:hypothetical protein
MGSLIPHFSPELPNLGTPHSPFFPTAYTYAGESGDSGMDLLILKGLTP